MGRQWEKVINCNVFLVLKNSYHLSVLPSPPPHFNTQYKTQMIQHKMQKIYTPKGARRWGGHTLGKAHGSHSKYCVRWPIARVRFSSVTLLVPPWGMPHQAFITRPLINHKNFFPHENKCSNNVLFRIPEISLHWSTLSKIKGSAREWTWWMHVKISTDCTEQLIEFSRIKTRTDPASLFPNALPGQV